MSKSNPNQVGMKRGPVDIVASKPTAVQLENRARFLRVNKMLTEMRRQAPPPIPVKKVF